MEQLELPFDSEECRCCCCTSECRGGSDEDEHEAKLAWVLAGGSLGD